MRVLIVYAHPELTSFNGAMLREAENALVAAGHEVVVSDLYAMRFDPVSDRRNFQTVADANRLNQQVEEAYAYEHNGFVPELQAEIDKLIRCDTLILQFPIWWMGMPAILKGWIDRVFTLGNTYGGGRAFDTGKLAGRRAMCSVTVGSLAPIYSERGIYGDISLTMYPIHHGTLGFTGLTVVEPFVVYGPARVTAEERLVYLSRYRERILQMRQAPSIAGPKIADYEGFVLKSASRK
jgi:NAD(P)H dehydrogenase (quinone)